jgi:hypothetical protein
MNNPANDQNPAEPPAAAGAPPPPAEDLELIAPRECPDCRPEALDPLGCRARGVKEEAAYDEQHKDGPNPDQYETARLQYGKARHDATPTVASASTRPGMTSSGVSRRATRGSAAVWTRRATSTRMSRNAGSRR